MTPQLLKEKHALRPTIQAMPKKEEAKIQTLQNIQWHHTRYPLQYSEIYMFGCTGQHIHTLQEASCDTLLTPEMMAGGTQGDVGSENWGGGA
jgi:hypothetical protein